MNITVFGSGYVGLVQAIVLADVGHQVVCIDLDAEKISRLSRGELPIYEPGLDSLLREFNFEVRHSPMPPDGTLRIP